MNTACIVVVAIAVGVGAVAAYFASGSANKSLPAKPVAELQTEVLVGKSDGGHGQSVCPKKFPRQPWTATTSSNNFIRRNERLDAISQIAGLNAAAPLIAGGPILGAKLVKADRSDFMAVILPTGTRAIPTEISPETRGFLLPNNLVYGSF